MTALTRYNPHHRWSGDGLASRALAWTGRSITTLMAVSPFVIAVDNLEKRDKPHKCSLAYRLYPKGWQIPFTRRSRRRRPNSQMVHKGHIPTHKAVSKGGVPHCSAHGAGIPPERLQAMRASPSLRQPLPLLRLCNALVCTALQQPPGTQTGPTRTEEKIHVGRTDALANRASVFVKGVK